MDDIGSWLYIIVLIIAGISGLFGSGKKKKHPTDVLGQPEYEEESEQRPAEDKSFWDLFDEVVTDSKKESKPQPVRTVNTPAKPAVQPKRTMTSHTHNLSSTAFLNNPVSFQEDEIGSILNEKDNIDEHYLLENEDFHDVSELRKAIIYTEILNRKY